MSEYTLPSGRASIIFEEDGSTTTTTPAEQGKLYGALKEALIELERLSKQDTRAHRLISTGDYIAVRRVWVKRVKRLHGMLWHATGWVGIHKLGTAYYGMAVKDAISEVHKDAELFVGGDDGSIY